MNEVLDSLLREARVWRGTGLSHAAAGVTLPTGFARLDACLPGGGWPAGTLTEILVAGPGCGELRLVMPLLAQLCARGPAPDRSGWIAWMAPPHLPYAPALEEAGVDLARVLLVHPKTPAGAMWAAEQALRSGNCAAVLVWNEQATPPQIRRLKLAAEEGGTLGLLFRPCRALDEATTASLRLELALAAGGITLYVRKSRGGRPHALRSFFT